MFEARKPTKHIKELCAALGSQYEIRVIDFEQVIYRDFGNGFNVEISGVNHNSSKRNAWIYMWRGHSFTMFICRDIPQDALGAKVEELLQLSQKLVAEYGGDEAALHAKSIEYYEDHYEHM